MACNVLEHVVTLAISLINDGETPPSQFEKKKWTQIPNHQKMDHVHPFSTAM
jgi:hypothetical protein